MEQPPSLRRTWMLGLVPVLNPNNAPQGLQSIFFSTMSPAKQQELGAGNLFTWGQAAVMGCMGTGGQGHCSRKRLPSLSCARPCSGALGTHYSSGYPLGSRGKRFSFVSEHISVHLRPGTRERSWEPQSQQLGTLLEELTVHSEESGGTRVTCSPSLP